MVYSIRSQKPQSEARNSSVASPFSNPQSQAATFAALRILCEPGEVYEIRCPKATTGTASGYFDDLSLMARHAGHWSAAGLAPAIYFTINPVRPELLARAANRVRRRAFATTADHEVAKRRRLLLDFDPVRPPGTSSTDGEHAAALVRASDCRAWLSRQGFPDPLLADSGNGAHLVYGIDLPNDDESRLLVEGYLRSVAGRFSDTKVKLDTSVSNAARISKVYGTMVRKGENSADRPHRTSRLLEAPARLEPAPRGLLTSHAFPPSHKGKAPSAGRADPEAIRAEQRRLDGLPLADPVGWVEAFLASHQIAVRQAKQDNGRWLKRWVLARCPFCESEDAASAITVSGEGKIGFRCQHNRCTEPRKRWEDFRRHYEPDVSTPAAPADKPGPVETKPGRLARLVEHATSECELACDDASEEALARIPGLGWRPVESKGFRTWLVDSFRRSCGEIVRGGDLSDALLNVTAACRTRRKTHHRVARLGDSIYLDLGHGDGRAVQLTPDGWRVIDGPPVVFLTKKDMSALPLPQPGGSVEELRDFVNVAGADFGLYVGWLLDALKGHKPYSVLVVNGEQGSGKSTFSALSGDLIDPCNVAKTKSLPKDLRDLAVLASNRHLLAFDNVSWLSEELSDALCRLATGSGMAVRSLYSNAEEQVFGGARPVLLNGIPEIGDRSDFLGRTVKITLRAIPEDKRQDEKAMQSRFEARRPHILGALCSLLSNGLKHEGQISAGKMPRMADTYLWLKACEAGTGLALAEAFEGNLRENVKGLALEMPLGRALVDFLRENARGHAWQGPATELHDLLRPYWERACGGGHKEMAKYPGNARALSGRLTEMTASLRENGVVVEKDRTGAGRVITIDAKGHLS